VGQFVTTTNATSCDALPQGFIAQADGSSSAKVATGWRINQTCIDLEGQKCKQPSVPCPAGTRGNETAATDKCTPCKLGRTSVAADVKCTDCPKGKYGVQLRNSDEAITAVCKECPINQYRRGDDNESKTSCTSCPNGYNTNGNRGESLCLKNGLTPEDCGTAQFLNNKNAVSGSSSSGGSGSSSDSSSSSSSSSSPPPPPSTCDACPRGGACDGLTEWSDVTSPANKSKIKPLFGWSRCARSGATSVDHMFERCPFAAACLGAPNIDLEDKFEGGVATQRQPEGCNTAYRNVSDNFLCFGCAPGYSHTSGDMSGKCDECPLPGENVGIAVLGVLLGIAGLFVYVRLTLGDSGSKDASDGVKSIGLSFVQIISLLTTFPVAWPAMFTALFQIGGAVTVLGQHLVNLKCMFPERSEAEVFYSSQVVWAMIPLGLAGASVAAWYVVDFVMVKLPRCGCMSRCKRAGAEEVLPQTTTHPSAGTVFARPPT